MGLVQGKVSELPAGINLSGRIVLVTGGNAGLGYEVARQYLQLHASTLILAVRNLSKGEEAKRSLLSDPSVQALPRKPIIDVLQLDLSSFRSTNAFTDSLRKKYDHLDIVLLNAGLNTVDWNVTEDGFESTLQVNYLSNALLSFLLLPMLKSGGAAEEAESSLKRHLTIVGSMAEKFSAFSSKPPPDSLPVLDYLNDKETFSKFTRYSDSKILVSMFIRQLAEHQKTDSSGVVIDVACPGMLVPTGLEDSYPWYLRWLVKLLKNSIGRSMKEGARSIVYASVVANKESTGRFYFNNQVQPITPFSLTQKGKEIEDKLWSETLAFVRKEAPNVTGAV